MDWSDGTLSAALTGLGTGTILGLAARRGRFCTLGAIEDALYASDWARVRMWALALSIAMFGTYLGAAAGVIDLEKTLYARAGWNPAAAISGGLIFGYGMAIAGNCGYGALARLGGGDLRSLVIVIVMGVAAYMVSGGPLSSLRLAVFPPNPPGADTAMTYTALFETWLSVPSVVTVTVISAALAAWAFANRSFRRSRPHLVWSGAIGIAVVLAWIGTSIAAHESFDAVRVEAHSYTRPMGEMLLYLMVTDGTPVTFGIGSVTGVVLGALIGSISRGHFRWEACDDPGELGRQILGGALMGIGGVLALGCSVGQGLTAFSTLALSAPVVLAAIFAGAALGLRHLIQGFALSA